MYATDISENQITKAEQKDNIIYSVQRAEKTDFGDDQFDLITVAQAIHWFDLQAFENEVLRVIKPDGILAYWAYGLMKIDSPIDEVIDDFYVHKIGGYWNVERKHVDEYLVSLGADMTKGGDYGPPAVGACETLNSYALGLSLELSVEKLSPSIGLDCLAMILSTYSRNPNEKHKCLKILEENGTNIPDNPVMLFHRGDIHVLQKSIRKDKKLLTRRFREEEIYPKEYGINKGDELHLTPLDGTTLLHMAAEFEEYKIMRILLDEGADSNARSDMDDDEFGGHTPLYHTVVSYSWRDTMKVKILLENGADTFIKASIRKQLKYLGDPELEKMHEFKNVNAVEYAEAFHLQRWVSKRSLDLIKQYIH